MAHNTSERKTERSFVDSIKPWSGSRSSPPTPMEPPFASSARLPKSNDHSISSLYGLSTKRYPPDCPPLTVQWFHAVDVPKRKPKFLKTKKEDASKTPPQPKKFVAFSADDSRAIETAYQQLLEEAQNERDSSPNRNTGVRPAPGSARRVMSNGREEDDERRRRASTRVPVNEDFLFDVDIEERELAPTYWLGPVYEVRRGSWYYQEGSTLRPCEENLAAQLEEGYLKVRPWLYPTRERDKATPKPSTENLKASAGPDADGSTKAPPTPTPSQSQPRTYRLFGTYMNSVTTYQDATTAWLNSDSMLSWVTSTVYERFAGGGYMSGIKLVRGNTEARKKEEKRAATPPGTKSNPIEIDDTPAKPKRLSAPAAPRTSVDEENESALESKRNQLTRHISNLMERQEDSEGEEEAIRQREEREMERDYNPESGETQGRDIEHLVLVTHGIGQLLGLRMESINFVHDVNVMRKTLKSVYSGSADLRALNDEVGASGPGNCRVQVLPVLWRHLLDFPRRKKEKRVELDIGETVDEEDEYPALEDITIEGVAFARSLISDLALDVLLYQSAYREQIADIVLKESNRIYKLFKERNPDFKGKVHVMGHSLGSAIMFDILCRQKEVVTGLEAPRHPLRFWPSTDRYESKEPKDLAFDFEVEDLYCLGSPVGLFQMLKGRTISARHLPNAMPSNSPMNPEDMQDPFLASPITGPSLDPRVSPVTGLPYSISSPKVAQLFNIFHPSDPIAYRLEPLISSAMSSLKPQALPYTKKGIFGAVAPQGLQGLGAKVGQSVSGLWSSLSAGISSSLLNRSLGLTQEDVAKITASQAQAAAQRSAGAGTNIAAGGVISPDVGPTQAQQQQQRGERTAERMRQLAADAGNKTPEADGGGNVSGNEATLIDDELETLFSRFQKRRLDLARERGADAPDAQGWADEERRAQKFRREEAKVRALNRNGRVDYSIQEGVLDFNPINTIASHMCYWADEDVSHFILSQVLSSRVRTPRPR